MRLVLAAAALFVIFIVSLEPPDREVRVTYVVLALYTIYSSAILLISLRRSDLIRARYLHWIDMLWYLGLISLNSGAGSLFFTYFFFAILIASFGWGYTAGLRLTVVSAVLVLLVGVLTAPRGSEFELLILRPIPLLLFGFLISRWGGFKINLRKRWQLLKEVTVLCNPRSGIDRTIYAILESLRSFYDADSALLLVPNGKKDSYQLYRTRREIYSAALTPPVISTEAADLFLLPFPNHAVIYRQDGRGQTSFFDVTARKFVPGDATVSSRVASALETTNYISVPVHNRHDPMGRLYVCGSRNRFDNMALDFVLQLLDHVTPLMENIRLVDGLASDAAEQERHRIARDIHDSVIQPYVGLQLGIAALAQRLRAGNTDVLGNVEELLELTTQELVEMRRYVWGLKANEDRRDVLLPAINRFVTRFASVTGIHVDVMTHGKVEVNDRLAAELFQIVAEGLSNVRRHALCNEARVEIACEAGRLHIQIKNPRPGENGDLGFTKDGKHTEQTLFTPRSIAERAALFGGETKVSIDENNYTVVNVAIPL